MMPDHQRRTLRSGTAGRAVVGVVVAIVAAVAIAAFAAQRAATSPASIVSGGSIEPPAGADYVRVAFVADTGYAILDASDLADLEAFADSSLPLPARVLKLIRAEGAELVLHGGDLGYDESGLAIPEKWDRMVTQILGADFPLFASGGNHDQRHWNAAPTESGTDGLGYRDVLRRRYEAVLESPLASHLTCTFPNDASDIGQRMACSYGEVLTFVTVGLGSGNGIPPTEIGQPDNEYEAYLKTALDASTSPWAICNWHYNQTLFQTGSKSNAAGWKPYEYCREAGALIATGHEHSYSRTHLMSRFWESSSAADIASTESDLIIDEQRTIAWVSGLGGKSIRGVSDQASNPWWAAKVNLTNLAESDGAGVLFCDFSLTSNAHAECFYQTVDGAVHDRFRLVSNRNGASGTFGGEVLPTTAITNPTTSTTKATTATPATTPKLGPLATIVGDATPQRIDGE